MKGKPKSSRRAPIKRATVTKGSAASVSPAWARMMAKAATPNLDLAIVRSFDRYCGLCQNTDEPHLHGEILYESGKELF